MHDDPTLRTSEKEIDYYDLFNRDSFNETMEELHRCRTIMVKEGCMEESIRFVFDSGYDWHDLRITGYRKETEREKLQREEDEKRSDANVEARLKRKIEKANEDLKTWQTRNNKG